MPILPVALTRLTGTDDERKECSPSKTKVMAYDILPEVEQFDDIIRSVYTDFCLTKLKSQSRTVDSWEQALMIRSVYR